MTDHRAEAERLLRESERRTTHEERSELLLRAQTHALLALTAGAASATSPDDAGGDLLSIDEVSALTRVPVATLRYYRATERGPNAIKIAGRLRYRRSEVEAWVEGEYARAAR